MDPIYWAAIISFVIGACGYIIVRFWIIPIVRYKRCKMKLRTQLEKMFQKLPDSTDNKNYKKMLSKKRLQEIRRLSVKLVEIHDADLPYWYRLILMTRKESPLNATEPILKLENMQTPGQARKCAEQICTSLGIHPIVT